MVFCAVAIQKLEVSSTYDAMKKQVTVSVAQTQRPKFVPLAIDVLENGKISRKMFG